MLREDYACDVWSADLKEESLVYWKTSFRVPPPKKEEPFKERNAEIAFRGLLENPDPSHRNTLFILAVMMERKRLFVEQGAQRDPQGNLMRIYEHKDSDETFLVYDPELNLDQIIDVQQEVGLQLGWIQPEPEPEPEPEGEECSDSEEDPADAQAETDEPEPLSDLESGNEDQSEKEEVS